MKLFKQSEALEKESAQYWVLGFSVLGFCSATELEKVFWVIGQESLTVLWAGKMLPSAELSFYNGMNRPVQTVVHVPRN